MNNPAFYPKAAFKIKLPAEAPPAAARRGKQGLQCISSCGQYLLSPAHCCCRPPIAAPAPREGILHVMPIMDSHAQW